MYINNTSLYICVYLSVRVCVCAHVRVCLEDLLKKVVQWVCTVILGLVFLIFPLDSFKVIFTRCFLIH